MCAHDNRGRLTVALGDGWRLYSLTIPVGCVAVGVVHAEHQTGALVRTDVGVYVRLNGGVIASLPQRKVLAAIAAQTPMHRYGHDADPDF